MEKFNCIICGGDKNDVLSDRVRDSENHKVVKCLKCGHIQLYPLPRLEEDADYYNHDSQTKSLHDNVDLEQMRIKSINDTTRRKNFMQKLVNKSEPILEVGSGYGFFIKAMEDDGYNIEGIEISEIRRQISKKMCSSNIYDYNLLQNNIPDTLKEKYKAVVLFHVLEHIINPTTFLNNIKTLLKNDGLIVIEIPNADDHLLKFCDNYRDFFWQRAHVSYFTPNIVEDLLRDCGFKNLEILGVQRYSVQNMMNWVIEGKPQLQIPSFEAQNQLKWLDDYYKEVLCSRLESDTLFIIASK